MLVSGDASGWPGLETLGSGKWLWVPLSVGLWDLGTVTGDVGGILWVGKLEGRFLWG